MEDIEKSVLIKSKEKFDAATEQRTEEATADLRELQYWTEIANTIIKLAQVVGNLTIGGRTGKMIREYTEKRRRS